MQIWDRMGMELIPIHAKAVLCDWTWCSFFFFFFLLSIHTGGRQLPSTCLRHSFKQHCTGRIKPRLL